MFSNSRFLKIQIKKTRPGEANDASFSNFFCIFKATFSYFHSHCPSFLLVPPSSSSLLPPRSSIFLVQHCLNHSESVKVHFSLILTKALPTDRRTNQPTNQRTRPLIEMRTHLKNHLYIHNHQIFTIYFHCPPLLTPGQGSMTIFNVWFLILQATSLDRIRPKINLFWSDFGEKCIFRVF